MYWNSQFARHALNDLLFCFASDTCPMLFDEAIYPPFLSHSRCPNVRASQMCEFMYQ